MLYDAKRWDLTKEQQMLLDAAQYIRDHGWCQNVFERGDGSVCMQGALGHVDDNGSLATRFKAQARLNNYVFGKYGYQGVTFWNDVVGRTKEEAIEALESSAYV